MLSPAEPVKPVSQPSRESLSAMYSLWRGGWGCEKWPGGGIPHPGARGSVPLPCGRPWRARCRRGRCGRAWHPAARRAVPWCWWPWGAGTGGGGTWGQTKGFFFGVGALHGAPWGVWALCTAGGTHRWVHRAVPNVGPGGGGLLRASWGAGWGAGGAQSLRRGSSSCSAPGRGTRPLACLGERTPGQSGMATMGTAGWPQGTAEALAGACPVLSIPGMLGPVWEPGTCPGDWSSRRAPPKGKPTHASPPPGKQNRGKKPRRTVLGLGGGPWIWSLAPPSPATGTSPTYPGEGAARLRSTGRAAWLLGRPRAAGRGRDVSFCLEPGGGG